jgi:hypothetical protein
MATRLYGTEGLTASAEERAAFTRRRARAEGIVEKATIDSMAKRMARVMRLARQEEAERLHRGRDIRGAPRGEDVALGNHDAQDAELAPEPLVPSALSAVWFARLPDAVPDRAPLRAADPEAAWRGPLADDLLPVVQQWGRLREWQRQQQQATKQARRERLQHQRYAQIRRSLMP